MLIAAIGVVTDSLDPHRTFELDISRSRPKAADTDAKFRGVARAWPIHHAARNEPT